MPTRTFLSKTPPRQQKVGAVYVDKKKKERKKSSLTGINLEALPVGGWEGRERTKENPNEVWREIKCSVVAVKEGIGINITKCKSVFAPLDGLAQHVSEYSVTFVCAGNRN